MERHRPYPAGGPPSQHAQLASLHEPSHSPPLTSAGPPHAQVPSNNNNAPYGLRQIYQKYLLPYDEFCANRASEAAQSEHDEARAAAEILGALGLGQVSFKDEDEQPGAMKEAPVAEAPQAEVQEAPLPKKRNRTGSSKRGKVHGQLMVMADAVILQLVLDSSSIPAAVPGHENDGRAPLHGQHVALLAALIGNCMQTSSHCL